MADEGSMEAVIFVKINNGMNNMYNSLLDDHISHMEYLRFITHISLNDQTLTIRSLINGWLTGMANSKEHGVEVFIYALYGGYSINETIVTSKAAAIPDILTLFALLISGFCVEISYLPEQ